MTISLTFDEFYREAFAKGLRHLYHAFGLQKQDAEEIVQHALVAFWQDHPDVSLIVNPLAFFRGYLRMHALRVLGLRAARPVTLAPDRASVPRGERPLSLDLPRGAEKTAVFSDFLPSTGPSVEAIVMARLQWQEVRERINALPLEKRVVFHLLTLGYDLAEIQAYLAQHFGFTGSYRAVATRLHEIRGDLRQQTQVAKVQRRFKKASPDKPWSPHYPACRNCETTTIAHAGHGYCQACEGRMRRREERQQQHMPRKKGNWAYDHAACIACGTTQIKHAAQGYCASCYRIHIRKPKLAATPVAS